MKKVIALVALAAAIALIASEAAAFDLTPGAGVPDVSESAAGATAAVSSDGVGLRVFSANGINVGTAVSTTTGPGGTFITVAPALTFITGIDRFQVDVSSAKTADGKITLAMTDTALRTAVAAAQSGSGTPTVH